MPLRNPLAKPAAQQNHAKQKRAGSRYDVNIERPLITVPEIAVSVTKKIRLKIWGHVVAIIGEYTPRNLDYQQARHQNQDNVKPIRVTTLHATPVGLK